MSPTKSQNARIDKGFPTICRLPMVPTYIKVPTAEQHKRTVCMVVGILIFLFLMGGPPHKTIVRKNEFDFDSACVSQLGFRV